ncbi:5'-nucleotidase [Lachnospiraceae bacterium]|nr:5'-nucleotidase [Lachnospiraceae bacterium]
MRFRYLLFDLDGTLTDPKEGITASVQYALHSFGIEEPDLDRLTPFIGPPLKDSFMEMYGFNEKQAEEAIDKYREWFRPTGIFQNAIYPGIREMLEKLKMQGKVLAVASSKPQVFVEQILHHFEIYDYFTVIVGSELDGKRGTKEEVVEEALRQLSEVEGQKKPMEEMGKAEEIDAEARDGMQSRDVIKGTDRAGNGHQADGRQVAGTVMIGDRKFDVSGGKEYGLVTVGVTFGYAPEGELEMAGPDYLVDSVEELGRLLAE